MRQRAVRVRNALRAACRLRPSHVYFIFNKPVGCVSQRDEQRSDDSVKLGKAFDRVPTVYDRLPSSLHLPMVPHVGRLDKETDGLLLFTDDGKLQAGLVNPNKHKQDGDHSGSGGGGSNAGSGIPASIRPRSNAQRFAVEGSARSAP